MFVIDDYRLMIRIRWIGVIDQKHVLLGADLKRGRREVVEIKPVNRVFIENLCLANPPVRLKLVIREIKPLAG